MESPLLPADVRVIVRDWLNANQIVLDAEDGCVVIDAGHSRHAAHTVALLERAFAGKPLRELVNTHCHVDHMGGNAAIRRRFGAVIAVPEGEAAGVRPWRSESFWMDYADQDAEPFDYDRTIAPGERFAAGRHVWEAIAAPGHDMGALMFWCQAQGVLISGDALWRRSLGVVLPDATGVGLAAALETLEVIERLAPRVVIPGHGVPFGEVADAVSLSRRKLLAFRADPASQAWHVLKVMLSFTLLARERMSLETLPDYLAGVPVYRQLNAEFLRLPTNELAARLVRELVAAGAAECSAGEIRIPRPGLSH